MVAIAKFFNTEATKRQLDSVTRSLGAISSDDSEKNLKAKHLKEVIKIIIANAEQFDKGCQQNIAWMGASLTSNLLNADDKISDQSLNWLVATIYRFVTEFDLSMQSSLSMELTNFQNYVAEKIEHFPPEQQAQIRYAQQAMPLRILKEILNHDSIANIRNVSEYSSTVDKRFSQWDTDFGEKELRVKALQTQLETQETAFNFVGLYAGFDELAKAKSKELWWLRGLMTFFGMLVLLPLITELFFIHTSQDSIANVAPYLLGVTALISLSLTLMLVYFLRLAVRSTDSCKAQLLQIELRKTLCRFIQNYATYSTEIKKNNPESLSKFENIIFSGIVSSTEKIPSTFDGIEQIASLVKAMKEK